MQLQLQPQPISNSSTPSRQTPAGLNSRSIVDPSGVLQEPQRPLSALESAGKYDPVPYDVKASPRIGVVPSSHDNVQSQHQYDDRGRHLPEDKDEAAPTNYDQPSRPPNSSTDPELEHEDSGPPQPNIFSNLGSTSDVIPRSTGQINTLEPYNETSAGFGSPQSVDSSNKTPTQADFTSLNHNYNIAGPTVPHEQHLNHEPEPSVRPRSAVSATDLAVDPENGHKKTPEPPQFRYSSQNQRIADSSTDAFMGTHAPEISRAFRDFEDSDATSHFVASRAEPPIVQPSEQYSRPSQSDVHHRLEEPGYANTSHESGRSLLNVPALVSPTAADVSNERAPRPFSFMDSISNQPERHWGQYSQREPSIDSLPSRMHPDRQPSPVSPQRSVVQDTPAQRGRGGPVHHGIDHDFIPDNSQTATSKRRSRSFSRLFKSSDQDTLPGDEQTTTKRRSRSISRLLKNPDLNDHPAFRQDALPTGGTDMPIHYYPEQISREDAIMPRQQATEYQLEGVGPPPTDSADARSRSRKNSKASSLFKTSNSPAKEAPVTKNGSEGGFIASPVNPPVASQKKPKRASLFRSLTGQKGHDHDKGRANPISPMPASLSERSQQSGPSTARDNGNSIPFDGESNKPRNKLQRASTSGFQQQAQDGGKKKRFSAMGVSSR